MDLEISFVALDGDTGKALPGAVIEIRAEKGGFCEEQEEKEFTLSTDGNGVARRLCRQCGCGGMKTPTRDTFGMDLPRWRFRVLADGYEASEWIDLEWSEYPRQVQRGDKNATLLIQVPLRKKAD